MLKVLFVVLVWGFGRELMRHGYVAVNCSAPGTQREYPKP